MKNVYLFIAAFLPLIAFKQITYTNSSFPAVNDSILTSTDFDSTFVVSPPSSTAQNWNYSMFTTQFFNLEIVQPASAGSAAAQFPNADIYTTLTNNFGSAYVDVTTTEVKQIGGGIDFFGFGMIAPFSDPRTVQYAPITYGSSNTDNFLLYFAQNIDSIPGLRTLIDSLTGGTISPDSIRFNFNGTDNFNVDAFGTLQSPDGNTYNVIRQKVVSYTNFALELRIPPIFPGLPGTWIDISSFVPLPIPANDTIIHYDYLADTYNQPIVRFNMDRTDSYIQSINFMGQTNVGILDIDMSDFSVYPNPSNNVFNISGENISNVSIYDLNGKIILTKSFNHSSFVTVKHQLTKGIYLIEIENDKHIRHQKLIVY
ncbi:MAG: hypothetical protein Kow0079_02390 [Vicingaceae bacterium]